MTILNLTQHKATPEQITAGVVDLPDEYRKGLVNLLTFDAIPDQDEINARTSAIVSMANEVMTDVLSSTDCKVMLGGAPFFMSPLEQDFVLAGWDVVYAFSVRESTEQEMPDGSIKKINVFKHVGFVEAF